MKNHTILIAGGSGLIGSELTTLLEQSGHTVRILSRTPDAANQFEWNPQKGTMDPAALLGVDAVINLAGAGIADKRWTKARKTILVESRVQSANLLFKAMTEMAAPPSVYLSASAVGIYGNSGETWMREDSAPADQSFMVDCCQQWEKAADQMLGLGIRTVKFRIGVVLAKEGGALAEIVKPLQFGLGAYFGSGQSWWPWIHREDVCRAFIWGIENQQAIGVFNLCSPNPVRGKQLVVSTAKAMRKWAAFLPAPEFVLRLLFGEMSAVILNSNRVSSEKLTLAGFQFKWPALDEALLDIFAPESPDQAST